MLVVDVVLLVVDVVLLVVDVVLLVVDVVLLVVDVDVVLVEDVVVDVELLAGAVVVVLVDVAIELVDDVDVLVDVVDGCVVDVLVAAGAVVVVGCGGQSSNRGPHTRTKRSRSARPAAAVTCSTSFPGRGLMTGPRTGTTRSVNGAHPEVDSESGTGSRSCRTVRRFSAGGGVHWRIPRSRMHRRARNVHDPLHSPSWSQDGSPSTQNARWGVSGGARLSRSSCT